MLDAIFGNTTQNKKQLDELQTLVSQARDERAALSAMLTQMAGGTSKLAQTSGAGLSARRPTPRSRLDDLAKVASTTSAPGVRAARSA